MPLKRKPERNRLVLSGESHPEWRETLEGFREVCVKDGLDASYELFKMIRDKFLVEHHWPPGNPQQTLDMAHLPKNRPLWKTCKYSDKRMLNDTFYCHMDWCARSGASCQRTNKTSKCYREE